jgi:hypothetical protein
MPADGQDLPVLHERAGTFSSIGQSLRLVVHDQGSLATLPVDIGPVDFEREMVLVAAMGPTPSEGYFIRIRRVWRHGQELRAEVDIRYPSSGGQLRGRPASPYHVVVVPRCHLNVRDFDVEVPPSAFTSRRGRGSRAP